MTPDTLAPAMGGLVVLFALFGGAYGALFNTGAILTVVKLLPSFWLVQAGKAALVLGRLAGRGMDRRRCLDRRPGPGRLARLPAGHGPGLNCARAGTVADVDQRVAPAGPADAEWIAHQRKWTQGWRRFAWSAVPLIYLVYVAGAVAQNSRGPAAVWATPSSPPSACA